MTHGGGGGGSGDYQGGKNLQDGDTPHHKSKHGKKKPQKGEQKKMRQK